MSKAKVWKFGTGYAGITARGKRIFKSTKSAAETAAGVKKRTSPASRKTSSGGKKRVPSSKKTSPSLMGNLGFTGWLEAIAANIAGTYAARIFIPEDLRAAAAGKILYGAQGHILNRRGKQFLPIGIIDFVADVVMDFLETGQSPLKALPPLSVTKVAVQSASRRGWQANGIVDKYPYAKYARPGESRTAFQLRKKRLRVS